MTPRPARHRISSGSPYESVLGFSRAVRVGERIVVSGCAPVMPPGEDLPASAYAQARRCLAVIEDAVASAGGTVADVVRTRVYLTEREDLDDVARAHAETFGDTRPACTVVVTGLLDARWRVEIEAEAVLDEPR